MLSENLDGKNPSPPYYLRDSHAPDIVFLHPPQNTYPYITPSGHAAQYPEIEERITRSDTCRARLLNPTVPAHAATSAAASWAHSRIASRTEVILKPLVPTSALYLHMSPLLLLEAAIEQRLAEKLFAAGCRPPPASPEDRSPLMRTCGWFR